MTISSEYFQSPCFCINLLSYNRRKTRTVRIGNIPLGSDYPVRIQSMVNTNPSDINSTIKQVMELSNAGCEFVRLTVPSVKDAENLKIIKKELIKAGCLVPLIADVHFNPAIAEICAGVVEKVRINPGNYAEEKKLIFRNYNDTEYRDAFLRLHEKVYTLLKICKENGTVLRIGTNHGSLSDRIMSRYGDTVEGMVESTLEYVRICREFNFHDLVLSIKSSNPVVMTTAYRVLVMKMNSEHMDYPLHLGVTEAGEGEDGRIRSAVGIGALLADGIGDTFRVSLAEPPVNEIPAAKMILSATPVKKITSPLISKEYYQKFLKSFDPASRKEKSILLRPGGQASVIADISQIRELNDRLLESLGFNKTSTGNFTIKDDAADFIIYEQPLKEIPETLKEKFIPAKQTGNQIKFIKAKSEDLKDKSFLLAQERNPQNVLIIDLDGCSIHESRQFFYKLLEEGIINPVIIQKKLKDSNNQQEITNLAIETGSLLSDGFGEGLCINCDEDPQAGVKLAFNILQACRRRIFKTEFVICPTCGRTQFDLRQVSAQVKEKTSHLKGLKIGIMGCIVNGLGEMGDADYGFIGSGKQKVNLYRNKQLVKNSIALDKAVDELVSLIREDGRWVEPM